MRIDYPDNDLLTEAARHNGYTQIYRSAFDQYVDSAVLRQTPLSNIELGHNFDAGDDFFDWLVGKWLDTFGPMGPWVTTADQVSQPDRLGLKLWVNDRLQQDGNTGQMIFSPAEAIAFISQFLTLEPGDVISTGTPAGVGLVKKISLQPGDQIRATIEELGTLEHPVSVLGAGPATEQPTSPHGEGGIDPDAASTTGRIVAL